MVLRIPLIVTFGGFFSKNLAPMATGGSIRVPGGGQGAAIAGFLEKSRPEFATCAGRSKGKPDEGLHGWVLKREKSGPNGPEMAPKRKSGRKASPRGRDFSPKISSWRGGPARPSWWRTIGSPLTASDRATPAPGRRRCRGGDSPTMRNPPSRRSAPCFGVCSLGRLTPRRHRLRRCRRG